MTAHTLLSIDGHRYSRRRANAGDPECFRGSWLLERLDAPRDLVGCFATAGEADAAAREDADELSAADRDPEDDRRHPGANYLSLGESEKEEIDR